MSSSQTRKMPQGMEDSRPCQKDRDLSREQSRGLMSYLEKHRLKLAVVVICILVSSGASVASSLFLQTLIDDYIQPLLMDAAPVFGGLLRIISAMAAVFIAGW